MDAVTGSDRQDLVLTFVAAVFLWRDQRYPQSGVALLGFFTSAARRRPVIAARFVNVSGPT